MLESEENITNMIYEIRGKQVTLDSKTSAALDIFSLKQYDIGLPISVFNNFIMGGK